MAYFQEGDVFGGESRGDTALQLHVYSLETGKSQMIVENPEVKSFCWTNQHCLLYAFNGLTPQKTAYDYYYEKPDIYEASLGSKSAKLLISEGYDPVASPNGRWIAFKGWSNTASKAGHERFGLYIYDRQAKKRTFLHALTQRAPTRI